MFIKSLTAAALALTASAALAEDLKLADFQPRL